MRRNIFVLLLIACVLFTVASVSRAEERLMVLCGASFKLPMEEIVNSFKTQTGSELDVSYAGVGTLLSQITLSKRGDVLIVPSPDIMKKAGSRGHVVPDSVRNVGYFVPSINVQKGNPKGIKCLKDMTRPGIRIALANPEFVFVGMLGAEIVDKTFNDQERILFRNNIVTYAEDFSKLAALLVLKQVDVIIGFSYLNGWFPDKIDTIKLDKKEIQRIGVGQAALLTFSSNPALAEKFLDYLNTKASQDVFKKYHYFATLEEARDWIGAPKPVGGAYELPRDWTGN